MKKLTIEKWQIIAFMIMLYDVLSSNFSYFLALWLRFDGSLSTLIDDQSHYLFSWLRFIPIYSVIVIVVFLSFRLYKSMWRYASYSELMRGIVASLVASILHTICITFFITRMPISYYIVGAGLQFFFIMGIRFSYRL